VTQKPVLRGKGAHMGCAGNSSCSGRERASASGQEARVWARISEARQAKRTKYKGTQLVTPSKIMLMRDAGLCTSRAQVKPVLSALNVKESRKTIDCLGDKHA
jgi:hypothetical protein